MLEVRKAVDDILSDPDGMPAKAIASRMGIKHISLLYSWADPGEHGRDIPLERLLQLTLITGDGRALSALCAASGYAVIPIPTVGRSEDASPESLKALHEFSQFMEVNSKALMDGEVTEDELARILKEGDEAMRSIAKVMHMAKLLRRSRRKE